MENDKAAYDISASLKCISTHLTQVRQIINAQLDSSNQAVKNLLTTFDCHSGKMLRPALVLLSASASSRISPDHLKLAAIMEMIHDATLLHDDVIDDGTTRRSLPTVNAIFGNESAVLLGDLLLCKVFHMCVSLPSDIVTMIADATSRLCQGELSQIAQRKNFSLTIDQYIDIVTEKTARLFAACCQLAALLSGADSRKTQALYDFGLNTGIAFQITDDILDITGDPQKTGKTLTRDLDKNILTLPVIYLLQNVNPSERKAVEEKLIFFPENQTAFIDMLRSKGCLDQARHTARSFASKAAHALNDFDESDAKKALIVIADFAAARK